MKKKTKHKTPSRARYEQENPTISCRLDKQTREHLLGHLKAAGCSLPDFIKQHLAKEKNMIQKRVQMLASRQADPSVEDRLRCLEDLVYQILSIPLDTHEYPPYCPHCDGQELFRCEGRETESSLAHSGVMTWKCPKCGFFVNTYKRIDAKSIKWIDPDSGEYTDKPKTSARHWLKE